MPLYENAKCPVCGNPFNENDDIVVCPECGTPHHRECYNIAGHCANQGLHKSGYSYYDENKKEAPLAPAESPEADTDEHLPPPPFFVSLNGIPDFSSPFDKDTEKIDGESAGDIAAAVRTNAARFIEVFKRQEKTKRKASWNWGAFFFGAYYFFFRKMYKQGILLACINFALSLGTSFMLTKLAPAAAKLFESLQLIIIQYNIKDIRNAVSELRAASDFKPFITIYIVSVALSFIISIVAAIFADYSYRKTVSELIKRVTAQLEEGAAFQASPFMSEGAPNLSQEQMRRIYFARKGGTTFLAPIALFLLIETIISFL